MLNRITKTQYKTLYQKLVSLIENMFYLLQIHDTAVA